MTDDKELIAQCATEQVSELELLHSMYSSSELCLLSTEEVPDMDGKLITIASSFALKLMYNSGALIELMFTIPAMYPMVERPTVFVRANDFAESELNTQLRQFISEQELGSPLVTCIMEWILENIENYRNAISPNQMNISSDSSVMSEILYARFWIHSHHLYSQTKRADICRLAKRFCLRGFSTPGKPAVIVVEGEKESCEQFWSEVRSWNWLRITVRLDESGTNKEEYHRFLDFKEVHLSSANGKHVQTGEVKALLTSHGLGDKFNMLYDL